MPGNRESWGFNVPEPDTQLTYMIDIALTKGFILGGQTSGLTTTSARKSVLN
jgi:hypothetical protein